MLDILIVLITYLVISVLAVSCTLKDYCHEANKYPNLQIKMRSFVGSIVFCFIPALNLAFLLVIFVKLLLECDFANKDITHWFK